MISATTTTILSGFDLKGCFAGDGMLHPDLTVLDRSLPTELSESFFVAPPKPLTAATAAAATKQPPSEHPTVEFSAQEFALDNNDQELPKVGELLDKYRIEEMIGSGGFASVYKATHLVLRSTVALKVLHPWITAQRPHLVDQLCEEARFISLIDHPNVVRVLDVTTTDRFTFIVMEFIDGLSLYHAIGKNLIRPLEAIKIGMHICAGLDAGLQQGLVHRDIKPGNVLISRTGKAKIVDFGLARSLGAEAATSTLTSHTKEGEFAGTPAYIAPEQAMDFSKADFRADIYSLGATLFHAATGRPPFIGADPVRTVYAHIHEAPPDPRQLIPEFPEAMALLLKRMLAKRPEDRFASYAELSAEMRTIYNQQKRLGESRRTTELFSRVKNIFHTR